VLDGLPPTLPALLYADKVLDRIHADPSLVNDGSADPSSDIGERLLGLVAEAREAGVDPEQALRDAVRRLL
jgi:XTP/dITP diphosphohydrolase